MKYIYASIQKQKLNDIEIIFIDDNSKDNSPQIIKNLMKKDKRIILKIKIIKVPFILEIEEFYSHQENMFL